MAALLEALQRQPWKSHVHSMTLLITDSVFSLSEVYVSQNSGIFFSRDIDEMNIYHVRTPTCFAAVVYLTKLWWITVFTGPRATSSALTGCPEMERLIAEGLLCRETVQPILPWEDTYPFSIVNKSDFSQWPYKQMLPLLSPCCCFDYFSYCQYKDLPRSLFGAFPVP